MFTQIALETLRAASDFVGKEILNVAQFDTGRITPIFPWKRNLLSKDLVQIKEMFVSVKQAFARKIAQRFWR